jgi:hypothetical protein
MSTVDVNTVAGGAVDVGEMDTVAGEAVRVGVVTTVDVGTAPLVLDHWVPSAGAGAIGVGVMGTIGVDIAVVCVAAV